MIVVFGRVVLCLFVGEIFIVAKRQSDSDMESPEEFAAWAFAAGIPDPRGVQFGYQPLIPAPCFPAVSKMLWEFGFRHHADLQTRWVPADMGPDRNHVALGVSDMKPDEVMAAATEMLVSEFPDVAARLASATPENKDAVAAEQARLLKDSLDRLRTLTANLGGAAP